MSIGGVDTIFATLAEPGNAAMLCLRAIRRFWPRAVTEDAETGEQFDLAQEGFLPEAISEFLVYRDPEAVAQWTELGAVPQLANTMIHLLVKDKEVTVVVDAPKAEPMWQVLESIRKGLQRDIFCLRGRLVGEAA